MHAVVALALPAVEAFDLAIPAQVFADPGLPRRYEFTVCAPAAVAVSLTDEEKEVCNLAWFSLPRPVVAPR